MICIKNIYYMLSYAFQILNENTYKDVLVEEFDNVAELCSAILIKGVSSQIKKGLYKQYLLESDSLSVIRGKIDVSSSIKNQSIMRKQLVCDFDEFSINSYMNRIIKTTMKLLVQSDISKARKKELKKLLVYFSSVETLEIKKINWKLQFNKNNQTYRMLISICYLIIKGLLQTTSEGSYKLMDFIDSQQMSRLYEKFILEYYKKEHPYIDVSSSQIEWNLDDDMADMLPLMRSDIMLRKGDKTLIIDAKYYSKVTQEHYNVHTIHSHNLYQIYTYVKNYDKSKSGNVSGLLLYAETDEAILPNKTYNMDGNVIQVKTLDLNCDFEIIKNTLDSIIKNELLIVE